MRGDEGQNQGGSSGDGVSARRTEVPRRQNLHDRHEEGRPEVSGLGGSVNGVVGRVQLLWADTR